MAVWGGIVREHCEGRRELEVTGLPLVVVVRPVLGQEGWVYDVSEGKESLGL